MNVFDEMDKYWAEMAYQNQTGRQIEFLKKTLPTKGLILDLACGTGRHIIPLGKEGYSMVGLDLSSNLLRIAKKREGGVQLMKADMRFLPFAAKSFSAVTSLDSSFGYLPNEINDLQSLSAVREALNEGGMLIIDVFNREHLILKNKANRLGQLKWALIPMLLKSNRFAAWMRFHFFKWKEYPSFFLLQKRSIDAKGVQLHDSWVICDKGDQHVRVFEHNARLYGFKRLQMLLEQTGFTINAVYGNYEKQNHSLSSNRLILVASSE